MKPMILSAVIWSSLIVSGCQNGSASNKNGSIQGQISEAKLQAVLQQIVNENAYMVTWSKGKSNITSVGPVFQEQNIAQTVFTIETPSPMGGTYEIKDAQAILRREQGGKWFLISVNVERWAVNIEALTPIE